MKEEISSFLKGQFLLAMPDLNDMNFSRTVSCICEHTQEGVMGIILNRIHSNLTGMHIFKELEIDNIPETELIPVHIGGPVHINEIFVLHCHPFSWPDCFMITPDLALSNTIDILKAIALGKGPEAFVIFLGCAGWGRGQLENEIMHNAWLTCPIFREIIFDVPVEDRWGRAIKKIGIDPAVLSTTAGHA